MGKQYGEWGSLDRGMVKKLFKLRGEQKAELAIVMKSGWVESGRRTTLLWHLFGRPLGSYSPRQLVGRHWQLTMLQPAVSACHCYSFSGASPNFVEKFPRRMLDMVLARELRTASKVLRELTRFVAGARGWQAMMQVRRRKSGGARGVGGARLCALTFARLLPDRGRRDITITLVLYTSVFLKAIRGLIALRWVSLLRLPRLQRNCDFLSQQFTRIWRKQRQT